MHRGDTGEGGSDLCSPRGAARSDWDEVADGAAGLATSHPLRPLSHVYNGQLLSGVLADGSTISAEIFNGVSGSQIVLAAAPIPLPAAAWLVGPALVGLLGRAHRRRRA
jgi:hypothetical protein